ncbi:apoptosis regulator BAX isoform X2 [Latimeria chalumnae]|uniref:apoptosis regulator BAX isoform X2 n=1 Tax=Latimeria chalumnae TaxID=7897 RepID=UPI0003C152A2|nr:PREDICTED: apoptosis regulator BAX-like isoform X2 [Latimeria chalumnae]|eukprot:XP_005996279.1 PREDICTED: apoptosis regulator BAX-like isoform X2 [Latimeria chalumnae]
MATPVKTEGSGKEKKENQGGAGGTGDAADEQLKQQAGNVLRGFIVQLTHNDDQEIHLRPEDLGGSQNDIENPKTKEIVNNLIKIGDELNKNVELQRMIENVPIGSAQEVFFQVAQSLFAGGINWGRIVALFYFTSKLVLKAITTNLREIITTIVNWTLDFIVQNVIRWVREQGGWIYWMHLCKTGYF